MHEAIYSKLKILDCTFRDGGYYNDWDFTPGLVEKYLNAVENAKIDYVEVGFRFDLVKKYAGPFAYSTDKYLSQLNLPKNAVVGVMVNAKEIINLYEKNICRADSIFANASESPVDLIRIAAHFSEISACGQIVKDLKAKGYRVGFNLMQTVGKTNEEIKNAATTVNSWNAVEVLYFADSLGNLYPKDIKDIVTSLRAGWEGEIGIHAHDNKGFALINTLTAIDAGVTWLDGTMMGMGRGAGNTKTEHLLMEINLLLGEEKYKPESLASLVLDDFTELKREYKWGSNLLYYTAACHSIHPTYIQELLGIDYKNSQQLINGVNTLKKISSTSYDNKIFENLLLEPSIQTKGTCSAKSVIENQNVLILASGPGSQNHSGALMDFIKSTKPFVISLNADSPLPEEYISAYATCHPARVFSDWNKYQQIKKPIILPMGAIESELAAQAGSLNTIDYGVKIDSSRFEPKDNMTTIPSLLVAPYVFSFAAAGGAKTIFLAGFDGFPASDPRQNEMIRIIEAYHLAGINAKLVSLTPTSYPVEHSSVYAPRFE